MFDSSSFTDQTHRPRHRLVLAVLLALIAVAAVPAVAGATLRVVNHNDPAGDETAQPYSLSSPSWNAPINFSLSDGDYKSFGSGPGTYTVQASPPAGWQVADIQCVGPAPTDFSIDVPNGRVAIAHGAGVEQTCSFTIRRGPTPSGQPPSPGVAPSPPASELSRVVLPRGPAVVRVSGGRGFAAATIRITQRSVIRGQLLHRTHVVGSTRVARAAGTHIVKVFLRPSSRRRLAQGGRKRVILSLHLVIVQSNGAKHIFTYRVVVRLT